MLIAELNGERKFAPHAKKGFEYFCPECGEEVLLKKGRIITHHFSHKSGSNCSNGKGESKEHLRAKYLLYNWAVNSGMNCDLELAIPTPMGPRRADVYIEDNGVKYALEVQKSPIEWEMLEKRTESYRSASVHVIWIPVLPRGKNLSAWHLWIVFSHSSRCWFWDPDSEGFWLPNLSLTSVSDAIKVDWSSNPVNSVVYPLSSLRLKKEYCAQMNAHLHKPHKRTKKKIPIALMEGIMGGFYLSDSNVVDFEPNINWSFTGCHKLIVNDVSIVVPYFSKDQSILVFRWGTHPIEVVRSYMITKLHSQSVNVIMIGAEVEFDKKLLESKGVSFKTMAFQRLSGQ